MNDTFCCINTCRLNRCPKIAEEEPSGIFICAICDELINANCFRTQENQKICGTCVDTMTVWDALVFLGCLAPLL